MLDLGCGPGFWVIELSLHGAKNINAADLTQYAISLAQKRANIYDVQLKTSIQNAESMSFEDGSFSHVNCQGGIHHTPNTELCVSEIARVLEPNGTALISVYFKNIFIFTFMAHSEVFRESYFKIWCRSKGKRPRKYLCYQ